MRIAKFLGWQEFVVAFFAIAFASTAPNFFVGISSALHRIPELSFSDVLGGNIVDLTLAVALAVLIARRLPTRGELVQRSSLFTALVAILPLLLILDRELSRGDGLLLIGAFFLYIAWLFSKKEHYLAIYKNHELPPVKSAKTFLKDIFKVALGVVILGVAAEGIVRSASLIVQSFGWQLSLIGLLVVGLGNALPETYFAFVSARKGHTGMILGDLMGSVIAPASLVLGVVVLIHPIAIADFSPFFIARLSLMAAVLLFLLFVRTGREITKKEAAFLIFVYLLFLGAEIFVK